jgi:hypothetical protein
VLDHHVEEAGGAREERLALAPVRADLLQPLGREAAVLGGQLLVEAEARVALGEVAQLAPEDHVVGVRSEWRWTTSSGLAPLEVAQHAHDRRDPAARR